MQTKRKVLFVIYAVQGGGAEKVLVDLANALPPEKYEIAVRVLMDTPQAQALFAPHVQYRALLKARSGWLRKVFIGVWQYLVPCRLAYRWFFGGDDDVEIAYMEGYPTKLLAHSTNAHARRIAWEHIDPVKHTKQNHVFLTYGRQKRCYARYDKICCVSEGVRDSFVARFGMAEKTEVVYNLLDDEMVRHRAAEPCPLPRPAQGFRLVSVGRLVAAKRFDRMIAVVGRLRHEGVPVELLILGEGAERDRLTRQIADAGLKDAVHLLGFQANPYPYVASADAYICASDAEGYSTAVCEALIVGTPVVTTDCAGMREILGDSEYGLITACTEEALCAGARRMLCNPACLAHYRARAAERAQTMTKAHRLAAYEQLLDNRDGEAAQRA